MLYVVPNNFTTGYILTMPTWQEAIVTTALSDPRQFDSSYSHSHAAATQAEIDHAMQQPYNRRLGGYLSMFGSDSTALCFLLEELATVIENRWQLIEISYCVGLQL